MNLLGQRDLGPSGEHPHGTYEPMSTLDATFMYAEDGVTHMHIGSCAVFAGPPPTIGEIRSLIGSKMPLLRRYRQKVRVVPGNLAHPVWVDDADFDLRSHILHAALPEPGGEQELHALMGRLMSEELDRSIPLWEEWFVEGLSGDRWALISKVHHCMVDGVSGTDLMTVLLDADDDAAIHPPVPWLPIPQPSDSRLLLDASADLASSPARRLRALASDGRHPLRTLGHLGDVANGLRSLARCLVPTKASSLNGPIGSQRRWAAGRCTLDDVKTIRTAFGGSVNDVVLAAITGAFRAVLIASGDDVGATDVVHSLVPVSLRREGDHELDNQVSMIIAELPIGIGDARARLAAICAQMTLLKASHQATAATAITDTAAHAPPALVAFAVRAAGTLLRSTGQQIIDTVTTNVPGPRYPLYAIGREMLEYLPFVPIGQGVRIGVAIMSYNGVITFGITGDDASAPDVQFMARQIESEIAALLASSVEVSP